MNPFLRIARPHKGHFLALEDLFLLIDQANPKSQAPRRINARLANHTPTHKTPVSLTADLRHTFLYLTQQFFHMRSFKGVTIDGFTKMLDEYMVWYRDKRIKLEYGMSIMGKRIELGLVA